MTDPYRTPAPATCTCGRPAVLEDWCTQCTRFVHCTVTGPISTGFRLVSDSDEDAADRFWSSIDDNELRAWRRIQDR